jgi:TPR repeat protein
MKTLLLIIAVLFSANSFAWMDEANAAYREGDYKTALREIKVLAEQGDAGVQVKLGYMYNNSEGITHQLVINNCVVRCFYEF